MALNVPARMPKNLYKFLALRYAESMASDGTVKIGTLFGYRGLEGDDPERGDAGEGRLTLHSDTTPRVYNSTAELPPVLRGMSIACGPGGIATNGEDAVVFTSAGADMFVYCVSEGVGEVCLREWGGACVRIEDSARFFQGLDAALRDELAVQGRQAGTVQVDRCSYHDRRHNWHAELPAPWLLKPLRYEHQREVRAGWTVERASLLTPVLVRSPAVAASCAIHAVDAVT